ncbi:MAG: LLM class F420-dependent oxidoreductase [Candidatus Nanopelagicales bacterium]
MRVGVYAFATDRGLDPARLAREVEARGFHALMFPEHSHIPVSRDTAYPESYGGGVLPDFYQRTYDPFVSATLVAASTTRLLTGPGVALMALREPVHTAKMAASVDQASQGRFLFGVGFGWNEDEFLNLGVPFAGRHALVKEKIELMRALWTEDVAAYDGERVSLAPSWAWPKPVRQGGPPVLLGGAGPVTMKHAALWADAWYPTPPLKDPLLKESAPAFRRLVEESGRDPRAVEIGCAPGDATRDDLSAFEEHGVDFVNIGMVTGDVDADLARLDQLAEVARDHLAT